MPPAAPTAVSETLLARCRRHEGAAQLQLYNQLASSLMGVCLRYCPSRVEAEDALQNTFVKIFTRLDQYRGDGPFEAWARRIAVHTALHGTEQHRRRHAATAGTFGDHSEEFAARLPSAEPSALDQLAAADLLALLQTLPPGYRTVLNLYAVEGYAHAEIAALLGISEGTSKSQLARARHLLQRRLASLNAYPCHPTAASSPL
ncbi:RNA polymerase sigma factor [uncultured Hymenobacter sp.]|uniref:RNA polymerase sigma factor n=1 Tax=uncultured Hymenobacter sp. TaxID=170016 RepID=UPI0035CA1A01